MAAVYTPVISAIEYPLFRGIGLTSQFPIDYSAFLEFVDKETKEYTDHGIDAVKTNIDFAGFRQWFGTWHYATISDLFRYAATITNPK